MVELPRGNRDHATTPLLLSHEMSLRSLPYVVLLALPSTTGLSAESLRLRAGRTGRFSPAKVLETPSSSRLACSCRPLAAKHAAHLAAIALRARIWQLDEISGMSAQSDQLPPCFMAHASEWSIRCGSCWRLLIEDDRVWHPSVRYGNGLPPSLPRYNAWRAALSPSVIGAFCSRGTRESFKVPGYVSACTEYLIFFPEAGLVSTP